ncbi:seipin-2 isoform X2 [Cajanus cajan]|uniref:Seipin n=1 Tax=Cajanus cajan TaxID=3821 RepID=A0A151RDH9_CAJCA|nr:seipin-2 isoform X2 [Cajanus cajan]KYP40680.1 Seipin [Cajanus cajan]
MELPTWIHEDDDVFLDAFHPCPSEDTPDPLDSASTLSDPRPQPNPHSPATTIRRRSLRRGFPATQSPDSSIESNLIDADSGRVFRYRPRHRNLNKYENSEEKPDSEEAQRIIASKEDNCEGSTVTSAARDDAAGYSVDSAPRLSDSSSSLLELTTGLVINLLGFQMRLMFMFVTYPLLFMFHLCMFFMDPLGTTRRGKDFLIGILSRVYGFAYSCIRPYVNSWFKEDESIWSVAFRFGWGFLWSIYVCCVLFGLLVSSFVFSGFLMKCLVEKPIHMRGVLNFDYTKHSPVAYVPVMSCAGAVGGRGSGNNVDARKWVGERVIPSKHKVQLTISLRVPESGYNRNLGIFQIRVDFLLSNGKAIASSSQPCMLRFRSEPIRLVTTLLKIAPLVTGYISETQTLNVKMRGFVERDAPTSCLKVTLEQRAEYQPGACIPEIYDASMIIESELPLFKRIIWIWKMSIFIWVAMMAFFTELLFALVCCRPVIIPKTRQRVASSRGPSTLNSLQAQS